ncbi:hypothetical protein JW835_00575 [bacterium]|nr:hypothetical protein [bacterium]
MNHKINRIYIVLIITLYMMIHTVHAQIIINHTCTDITDIPQWAIETAKTDLHIAYAHTSHGRQPVEGMTYLVDFANSNGSGLFLPSDIFQWNEGGVDDALDLRNYDGVQQNPRTLVPGGAKDLGNPNGTQWAIDTRTYLNDPANSDINVIIWSWCGQLSGIWAHRYGWPGWESWDEINHCFHLFDDIAYDISSGSDLRLQLEDIGSFVGYYLLQMSELEQDYPEVRFIYMTGHLDGTGLDGILNKHNEIICEYCCEYNKILYDFADIESYDPDGIDFISQLGDDGCNYDANNNGITETNGASAALPINGDANWAIEWQDSHLQFDPNLDENEDGITDSQPDAAWYYSTSAHSQALNANLKAYASWWLWARLAGWDGTIPVAVSVKVFLEGPCNAGSMETGLQTGDHLPLESPYDEAEVSVIPDNVVDWLQVELRTLADGSGENYLKSVFLRNDGMLVDLDGSDTISINAPEGDYFIVVRHRNHLAVMSDGLVHLSEE